MIRRHGHYIVEIPLDHTRIMRCLKCNQVRQPLYGRTAKVFNERCKGNWKKGIARVQKAFDEAEKMQDQLLKWMAFDQKLEKKAR